MSLRDSPHAAPFLRPHRTVAALRAHLDADRPRAGTPRLDDDALADAYRIFLRRTQNVGVVARAYPGGFATLIRDRETVTILLVGLLQRQREA